MYCALQVVPDRDLLCCFSDFLPMPDLRGFLGLEDGTGDPSDMLVFEGEAALREGRMGG
jgi:hypothetical protein